MQSSFQVHSWNIHTYIHTHTFIDLYKPVAKVRAVVTDRGDLARVAVEPEPLSPDQTR